MFKRYQDICDVVSLLVCCHPDRTYLLTKEGNGEFWLPSSKVEKDCWKLSAHKINFEIFGMDAASTCTPFRVYKVWLPKHTQPYVYHVIYKVAIKIEVKRRIKMKAGLRNRLQWFSAVELERQRAHATLRSPELALFAQMATTEHKDSDIQSVVSCGPMSSIIQPKTTTPEEEKGLEKGEIKSLNLFPLQEQSSSAREVTTLVYILGQDLEPGYLIEICEENLLICNDTETGAGAVTQSSANHQLLQAAGYSKDDQLRVYREFMVMVYPALYMSPNFFTQFMMDIGFQRQQCPSLFRYFDSNRDSKLEYVEFKELVAAARLARQLPVDALSVARDADVCLRQLGMQPNSQLPLAEFLRGVGELHLRGTSSLLRASRSISGYLMDLQGKGSETNKSDIVFATTSSKLPRASGTGATTGASSGANSAARSTAVNFEYSMAIHTVKLRQKSPHEMLVLNNFDDEAVSPSTARLMAAATTSIDVLGPASAPVEAIAAVHYFAAAIDKPGRRNSVSVNGKAAWSWLVATEEAALGSLLLKLADAACVLVSNEPRLLRLSSPVYAVGDLHGNLPALLSMEAVLWPSGTALAPARLLFLGDYVDRGAYGTELMAYLLAAKLQRPHAILLIRGNHETRDIQKMFTFYNECITKYGDIEGNKIWNAINNVFDALPLAAVVDDKVFCCHGGIPPPWVCPLISAIDKVPVPLTRPAEQSSIAWELLWNDPVKLNKMTATLALELAANDGFAANTKRGTGHVFDQTALDRFLLANQLSHVVRAHELHQNGFMCQLRGRLISVFSSYHYCGGTNDSGVALLEGGKLRLIRVGMD